MDRNGGGRCAPQRTGRTSTPPPSEARLIVAAHCDRCRCRCRCHQPPRPDPPPPTEPPPQPGEPGWSAYVAVLSAKAGSLAAAYTLLGHATDPPAA
jgi:hypothetical protein